MATDGEILCGDAVTLLRQLPESTIDLTVFSPPYDGIRDYEGGELDLAELGRQILHVSVDGAACCVVINDGTRNGCKSMTSFNLATGWCREGWKLFETVIYARDGVPGGWWSRHTQEKNSDPYLGPTTLWLRIKCVSCQC